MTKTIYLYDSYAKDCDAIVQLIDGKFIILDQTVFFARGGGQPGDTGKIVRVGDNVEFTVLSVGKKDGVIAHEADKDGLAIGDKVKCSINWDRRYRLMRIHTATHILAAIMHKEEGVLISGNELGEDKARVDFNLVDVTKEKIEAYIVKTNDALKRNLDIKTYFLPRAEALALPGAVKLLAALPPNITELRIVEIGDVDRQIDGGTHVKNTSEVGEIELIRIDNKGASNRRVYFKLKD